MTAAVFPNWRHVRQEWGRWKLDDALPMLYHRYYNADIDWIGDKVRQELAFVEHGTKVHAGVTGGRRGTAQDFARMIEVSLEAGAAGVSLFNSRALDDDMLKVLDRYTRA